MIVSIRRNAIDDDNRAIHNDHQDPPRSQNEVPRAEDATIVGGNCCNFAAPNVAGR